MRSSTQVFIEYFPFAEDNSRNKSFVSIHAAGWWRYKYWKNDIKNDVDRYWDF